MNQLRCFQMASLFKSRKCSKLCVEHAPNLWIRTPWSPRHTFFLNINMLNFNISRVLGKIMLNFNIWKFSESYVKILENSLFWYILGVYEALVLHKYIIIDFCNKKTTRFQSKFKKNLHVSTRKPKNFRLRRPKASQNQVLVHFSVLKLCEIFNIYLC